MIQKSRMKKKCFCLILVFLMAFSQLPAAVFAEMGGEMTRVGQQAANPMTTPEAVTSAPEAVTTTSEAVTTTPEAVTTTSEAVTTTSEAVTTTSEAVTTTSEAVTTTSEAVTTRNALTTSSAVQISAAALTNEAMWNIEIHVGDILGPDSSGTGGDVKLSFSYGTEYEENGFENGTPLQPLSVSKPASTATADNWIYKLAVPSGEGVLYYKGTDLFEGKRVDVGGGAIPVSKNEQISYITRKTFSPNIIPLYDEDIYSSKVKVTVCDDAGWNFPLKFNAPKGSSKEGVYDGVLPTYGNSRSFVYTTEVNVEGYMADNEVVFTVNADANRTIDIGVYKKTEVTFQITKGAELEFGRKSRHYVPLDPAGLISKDLSDSSYDSYTFEYPDGGVQPYMWRVRKKGYVTQAKTMDQSITGPTTYTVKLDTMPTKPKRVEYSDASAEDSLLMNAPDSQYITLAPGKDFTIRPLRAWQIGNSVTANFYIEPEYHYTVVAGKSVKVTNETNSYNISHGTIEAIEPGVSLVRVTYDPIQIGKTYWNGTDPNQVGLIVFNVTDQNSDNLHTNIDVREYDTVYINDGVTYPDGTTLPPSDTASYTFTPDEGCLVHVLAPPEDPEFCTNWGFDNPDQWTPYEAENGSFAIGLKAGRNVVEVSKGNEVQYHVIRAVPLSVKIVNKTNPRKSPLAGDRIAISFKGMSMPLPKLAAIYNPGYVEGSEGSVRVEYSMNGERVFSKGTQYDLPKQNTIIVDLDEAGEYDFKNGGIYLTWYGSGLDAHRNISAQGLLPNFNAPDHPKRSFSYLPEFSIKIPENEELAEQQKLNYVKLDNLYRGNEEYQDKGELFQNIFMVSSGSSNTPAEKMETKLVVAGIAMGESVFGINNKMKQQLHGIPDGYDIFWRHWGTDSMTEKAERTEVVTEQVKDFPVTSNALTLEGDRIPGTFDKPFGNGELIFVPKDKEKGYPKTYSILFAAGNNAKSRMTRLQNIELGFPGGGGGFSPIQGILKATPVKDDKLGVLDLGYGYLMTETNYTVAVPYETKEITLKPVDIDDGYEDHGSYVKVSVNGVESQVIYAPGRGKNPAGQVGFDDIDGDSNKLPATEPISLKEGAETTIQMVVRNQLLDYEVAHSEFETYTPTTYTIKVIRESAPSKVQFTIPDGASLLVKKVSGTTMKPSGDNKLQYSLPAGEYQYIVSGGGYMATTFNLTVVAGKDQTVTVTADKMTGVEKQQGKVTVDVIGASFMPVQGAAVDISTEPADLTAYVPPRAPAGTQPIACVKYNYGGYTALHAILEALSSGQNPIDFTCKNGKLVPHIGQDETGFGPNAGWRCMVNGAEVAPATTLVKSGDRIDFFYDSDRDETTHAWFDQNAYTADKSQKLTLTLMSAPIGNTNPEAAAPCSGATIKLISQDGPKDLGKTDEKGQITLNCEDIGAGNFALMASLKDNNRKEQLTYNKISLIITGDSSGGAPEVKPEPGKINVTFRLIGDSLHKTPNAHKKYVTWIATKRMTLKEGATVYDAFTQALDKAGLAYVGAQSNYVSTITAPRAYGGYKLSEFSNGPNSGWMYTVNGQHPNVGLKYYTLKQGDKIIWHYVDDYKTEARWDGEHTVPTYSWLEAEDVDPPTDKVIDMSGGSAGTVQTESGTIAVGKVSAAAKTDESGKASASVSAKDIAEALNTALEAVKQATQEGKKDVTPQVEITVSASSKATGVETVLPASSIKDIVKSTGAMKLETPLGTLTFNPAALSALSDQATGSDIKLTISKVDVSKNKTLSGIPALKDRPVYQLSAASGDKPISDFKKGAVKMSLPYTLESEENPERIKIAYIDDQGTMSIVDGSAYDPDTKTVTGSSNHFSFYGIVNKTVSFTDVKVGAWYYDAVMYLANNGIVKGISDDIFAPDNNVTRAEFVQILYNKNKAPSVTSVSQFADVKDSAWYGKAIIWASEQEIVFGSAGTDNALDFHPDDPISRQDMAVILSRYLDRVEKKELKTETGKIVFADASSIADYAKNSVEKMQTGGIISGSQTAEGIYSFKPNENATRAEAASMLVRLFQTVK